MLYKYAPSENKNTLLVNGTTLFPLTTYCSMITHRFTTINN